MSRPVPPGPVAVLLNGRSRRGERARPVLDRLLPAAGLEVARRVLVEDAATVAAAVEDAVGAGVRLLVVGGGDGTVGAVAGRLAEVPATSRPVLGVLPLGTANDFARTLGLPRGLPAAVGVLRADQGKVVDVDLGRADGRPFLNVASLGLSVAATRALRPLTKRWLGPGAYPLATLTAYRAHRPFAARLEFPGGDHAPLELADLLQVAVGNGRHYGGGHTVAPAAGIDDALLDVWAVRAGRWREHLALARRLRDGRLVEDERVHHLVTPALALTTDVPHPVNLDGELAGPTPVTFRVERNAVEVVVPTAVTHLVHDAGRELRVTP